MKYLFIIQGEGRGHITQAISLFKILEKNGHCVCHAIVGKSSRRALPQFFIDEISASISQLESPNFITDRRNRSVKIFKTLFVNLWKIRSFLHSIRQIDRIVKHEKPDCVINFYDFLGGLYFLLKKPNCRHIALAHQFYLEHSAFIFPKGKFLDRALLRLGNRLASCGAQKMLCLSFRQVPDEAHKKRFVVPPLLREEIKMQKVTDGDYLLGYIVNDGYFAEVERAHFQGPKIPIHCFWDKKGVPEVFEKDDTLTFHRLNDAKFIQKMGGCKGYLTTAGFESICEAMYMGKPTLMVPVSGHYEQVCNALDAKKVGAGISSDVFDLELLLNYLPRYRDVRQSFHTWCSQAEEIFLKHLTT